jgi:hypothetical protein
MTAKEKNKVKKLLKTGLKIFVLKLRISCSAQLRASTTKRDLTIGVPTSLS